MARQFLPLTVWLCPDADHEVSAASSSSGQVLCGCHRRAVGFELARHLVEACTEDGELIAEAYTTNASTLRAATHLSRRAIGCVPHAPLARHISGDLRAALPESQLARLEIRPCRADQMNRGLAHHLEQVSLVIAAPPPYRLGDRAGDRARGESRCPACLSDSLTGGELRVEGFLLAAWRTLRRGGHLAVVTTARHEQGRLVDRAPRIIRQARVLGFRYSQHVIALRVPVVGDGLMVQAGPDDLAELRDVRSRALPPAVSVHADVCLFTKPPSSRSSDVPPCQRRGEQ